MRPLILLATVSAALLSLPATAYDTRDLNQLKSQKRCIGCDLSGANLRDENLAGADIRWSNLSEADLERAQLAGADLTGANLTNSKLLRANFEGANLQGVVFHGVDLSATRFSDSDLRWSDMGHLDINRDLSRMDIRGAQLEGVRFSANYRCSDRSQPGRCAPERR